LVSPFMENGTVMEHLERNPSSEVNRFKMITGIAYGMQYLHSRNFIHGNLQGSNVLLTSTSPPRPVLSGFGLTKLKHDTLSRSTDQAFISRVLHSPAAVGERRWMAPERLGLGKVSRAVDVWSFGCTVHEILTGRPPFDDLDPATIRKHILGARNTPISTHLPVPPHLLSLSKGQVPSPPSSQIDDDAEPLTTWPTDVGFPAFEGAPQPPLIFHPYYSTGIRRLVEGCWSHEPASRPNFDAIT
ncbi:hypothetical protein JAAARDRAFT_126279, partial [Jaapia argillacea MUCL 33604]